MRFNRENNRLIQREKTIQQKVVINSKKTTRELADNCMVVMAFGRILVKIDFFLKIFEIFFFWTKSFTF